MVFELGSLIASAAPAERDYGSDASLFELVFEIKRASPENRPALEAQYRRRRAAVKSTDTYSRVDPSERAAVAFEVLRECDALLDPDWVDHLVRCLLEFANKPEYPDLRAEDRIPLRDESVKAVTRLLTVKPHPDPARQKRRLDAMKSVRQRLHGALADVSTTEERARFALDALQAAGWGAAEHHAGLVPALIRLIDGRSGDYTRTRAEDRQDIAARLLLHLRVLKAVFDLSASADAEDRKIAQPAGAWSDALYERKRKNELGEADKVLLQFWEQVLSERR